MVMGQTPPADPLKSLAERYVKLVLAVGQHDADYVDAFYGPPEWRKEVETGKPGLATIDQQAVALERELAKAPASPPVARDAELLEAAARIPRPSALVPSGAGRRCFRASASPSTKSRAPCTTPSHRPRRPPSSRPSSNSSTRACRAPARSIERYDAFKKAFVIPPARVDRVFKEAIRSCRERTLQHVELPAEERFTVEYVTNKSWSGYNWYQGQYRSVIQVNTDLPIYIDRAIDLACHEGYPGHHVYNALLEKHLVRDRGWVEFTVYPLFSPQSLIAEGTANYGIEVAFSPEERLAYERDVLFPLAGLDATKVKDYYDVFALVDKLSYAGNEAARQYLNGTIDRNGAVEWLEKYAMYPRAESRTARALHRPVPQLRDQLQPRQRPGARLRDQEGRTKRDRCEALAGVRGAVVVTPAAVGSEIDNGHVRGHRDTETQSKSIDLVYALTSPRFRDSAAASCDRRRTAA